MAITITSGLNGIVNDISGVSGISGVTGTSNGINLVSSADDTSGSASFESLLESAKQMIQETNDYSNAAEEAELKYAMGELTSTHELQVAQQKANISLQYTVAVRNAVMDAYSEIMQLQF